MGAMDETSTNGLRVHVGNRLEDLLQQLVHTMARDPLPPEQDEVILVPSRGMEQWLERQLACSSLGICASVEMPFLAPWFRSLLQPTAGRRDNERIHALSPGVLAWRIHRLLGDACLASDLETPRRYFAVDPAGSKRMQLARRVATCFDQYQLFRPDMLAGWEAGQLATEHEDEPWQAAMWRALRQERLATGAPLTLAQVLQQLRSGRPAAVLPRRVQAFGFSSLPPLVLDLFEALGTHCKVDLYAFVPTHALMDDKSRRRRKAGETAQHELLAELGMQSADFVKLLEDRNHGGQVRLDVENRTTRSNNLLHAVQQGIEQMEEPRGMGFPPPEDNSLRLHVAHSPFREMEILRDRILDAMERDRTLRPNEILVLVADLENYAPAIHSVFQPLSRQLAYQVQDRTPAQEMPLVKAMVDLFRLSASRWTNVDVLELLSNPCLRSRFGLDAMGTSAIQSWIRDAGIHWGIDAQHRAEFGQPASAEHTWRHGLDRLVLGTMTGPVAALVDESLPLAHHGQEVAQHVGRFAWCMEELIEAHRELKMARGVRAWIAKTRMLLGRFLTTTSKEDREARKLVLNVLTTLQDACDLARHEEPLSLRTWTECLMQELDARGRSGFASDRMTFAALRPMRMVPARFVAVCGLGDEFPRNPDLQTFDLLQEQRRPGDRNARADDRQLFLEALMSARERLLLSYVGRSQRSEEILVPSAAVTVLLDSIDRGWTAPSGMERASEALVMVHPLQGFSRTHRADHRHAFAYADVEIDRKEPSDRFLPYGFMPARQKLVRACTVKQLSSFWQNPSRHFLQHALGLKFPFHEEELAETEDFGRFGIKDDDFAKLVEAALEDPRGPDASLAMHGAMRMAAGTAQPRWLGRLSFDMEAVDAQLAAGHAATDPHQEPRLVIARLEDCSVTAWVQGTQDGCQLMFAADRKEPKESLLLRAWIVHLTCNVAAAPGNAGARIPTMTRVVMPMAGGCFGPLCEADARRFLTTLVSGFREGHLQPLPFFLRTSRILGKTKGARGRELTDAERLESAQKAFQPEEQAGLMPESEDPSVKLCWRGQDLFRGELASRMLELAQSVWGPLLEQWEKGPRS